MTCRREETYEKSFGRREFVKFEATMLTDNVVIFGKKRKRKLRDPCNKSQNNCTALTKLEK